jgi:hypothetical protein
VADQNLGLIIRDDPNAVGDYIANYIAKRSVTTLVFVPKLHSRQSISG